jgi:SAM-dependent methyltransferase
MRLENAKTLLWKIQSAMSDFRLGISTRGIYGVETPATARYMTLPYATISAILKKLSLTSSDALLDIGCGKGRMLCCAALLPLRKVIGIEYSSELCSIAEQNASRLRGIKTPITIVNVRAQDFEYNDADVFYCYNPFGPPIFDEVLQRIAIALEGRSKPIRFIYANPLHEQLLKSCPWLEQYDELHPDRNHRVAVRISFWRSRVASR